MATPSPLPLGAIEVVGDRDDLLRPAFLSAVYRASRHGVIAFILQQSQRVAVDRALDPIVKRLGPGVHGIWYIDEADERSLACLADFPLIVAVSQQLREWLDERGISYYADGEGIRLLQMFADAEPEEVMSHGEHQSLSVTTIFRPAPRQTISIPAKGWRTHGVVRAVPAP